jgi:hypothetical protein
VAKAHLLEIAREARQDGLNRDDALDRVRQMNTGRPPLPASELDRVVEVAYREPASDGKAGETPTAEPWPEPLPLGQDYTIPEFPIACLPVQLGAWVRAEAMATQTPPDMAGLLALAVCGGGLARKVRVLIRPGWAEPLNIFTVVALPPGDRKSTVFADALAPIVAHERDEQERAAPFLAECAAENELLEKRLKVAEDKAAKGKDAEQQRLREQVRDCARQLAAHEVPPLPRLFCDDETPESLAKLLADQGGRILQASAEGTAFEIAKGRYSEKGRANFDVYLKGHSGDPLRVGRVSRGRDTVNQPALSVALAVQPDVINGLAEQSSMKGRGLLARFLYGLPQSRVGSRRIKPPPVPEGIVRGFHEAVLALWEFEGTTDDGGRPAPHWLKFSSEADELMEDFERWLEPQLAEGAELYHLAGWGSKLAGGVARVAGILHMAGTLGEGEPWGVPIPETTVANAIRLGRDYFLPHAKAAFDLMGADERLQDARAVLSWLESLSEYCEVSERGSPFVTRRDIHQAHRARFKTVEDLDPVLKLLVDYGWLRLTPRGQRGGPGRSPPPAMSPTPCSWRAPRLQDPPLRILKILKTLVASRGRRADAWLVGVHRRVPMVQTPPQQRVD